MNNPHTRAWLVFDTELHQSGEDSHAGVILTTVSSDGEHEKIQDTLKQVHFPETNYEIEENWFPVKR